MCPTYIFLAISNFIEQIKKHYKNGPKETLRIFTIRYQENVKHTYIEDFVYQN